MSHNIIAQSMIEHFESSIHMFKRAVSSFPMDEWRKGDLDYLRPAGVAYHIVENIEFYTGDTAGDKFPWGSRFGCDWEDPDTSKLPSQKQVLEYLDEVWLSTKNRLISSDPTQRETLFPWTGMTLHSRLLYLLRHIQYHTAEMCLELKRRGYSSPEWE